MSSRPPATPYRVSVTWGAFSRLAPAVDTTAALNPPEPGARNGVAFAYSGFGAALNAATPDLRAAAASAVTAAVKLPAAMPQDVDGSRIDVGFVGYAHILRGFVQKDKDARAVVVVNAAGTTKAFEFPYDAAVGGDSPAPSDVQLTFFAPAGVEGVGSPPAFPPVPAYGAEVFIAVERRTADAQVIVQLDALDVTAVFTSPDGPAPAPDGGKACATK